MKKTIFFIVAVVAIAALDRVTKIFSSTKRCFTFLCIEQETNKGASFSLFSSFPLIIPILIAIALAVLFVTAFFYFKIKKFGMLHYGLVFLFAGTLSNLLDRIFFRHVIDFITFSFIPFPAFNIADLSNVVGALLLIITLLKKDLKKKI